MRVQETNTLSVLKEMRNLHHTQRRELRVYDRRREERERAQRQEDLTRRSEARLQKSISEKNNRRTLRAFMNALVARQDRFLGVISKRLRKWASKQRDANFKHAQAFKHLNKNLTRRLRKLQRLS